MVRIDETFIIWLQNRSVNAILILHGLPYDLTAQAIAHEATHAYIKLSDSFPDHLPMMVSSTVSPVPR